MTMKMRLKKTNRSHRYDKNRPRRRHGHKYTKFKIRLMIMMVTCIKKTHLVTFEAQFMNKLSNIEAELKKSVAYTKKRVFPERTFSFRRFSCLAHDNICR